MKHYNEIENNLFEIFNAQLIENSEAPYISYQDIVLSFSESYQIVQQIVKIILVKNSNTRCIALNFKDQQKLLLSFWACAALKLDIILVPELELDLVGLQMGDYKLEADLMLTDFVEGTGCFDVISEITDLEVFSETDFRKDNHQANIYFFTSGTTGKSKFIKTSYHQFIRAINCIEENNIMPYTKGQKVLLTVPLFHSYGISAMIEYTQGGSHLFLPKNKDYISPLQSLLSEEVSKQLTAIEGVPYFYKQMAVMLNRLKLPNIRHIGMGGDSVTSELLRKLHDLNHNITFSLRYGVTEIPSVISINYFKFSEDVSTKSLGKVLPIYVTACDFDGFTEGELKVTCQLYPGQPHPVFTGDLVEYAGDQFTFKSRKLFVKSKGYKINPAEVEEYINENPQVSDSRVYMLNEVLTADIVPSGSDVPDGKAIKSYLAARINAYLIPDQYHIVQAIGRTKTGKVIR